tara:strand:+ start:167 stop:670 length:504 start_codon:yes stop_codon:yes gene_type:complete
MEDNSMSNIDCNQLREILEYQPETGLFFWKKAPNGRTLGQKAGGFDKQGYWRIRIDNVKYGAHRLAWMYVHGSFPKNFIDHINGNKSDNRICNLRDVTRSENMQNLFKPQGKNSFIGVYKSPNANTWYAKIEINGKQIRLGTYKTIEEAKLAYKQAKPIYHPTAPCR